MSLPSGSVARKVYRVDVRFSCWLKVVLLLLVMVGGSLTSVTVTTWTSSSVPVFRPSDALMVTSYTLSRFPSAGLSKFGELRKRSSPRAFIMKSPPSVPEVLHPVIRTDGRSGSEAVYLASIWSAPWFSGTLPGALPWRVITGASLTSVTVTVTERLAVLDSGSRAWIVTL